ncbi:hypothetical protein U91I_02213 [alpha proteobacterium U9-1i]|nr:hypothetical protein U91I_02213 [alpha proteobacterium U9-1i]
MRAHPCCSVDPCLAHKVRALRSLSRSQTTLESEAYVSVCRHVVGALCLRDWRQFRAEHGAN